jgi:hypothetical protein
MKKDMCLAFCEGFWFRFGVLFLLLVMSRSHSEGTQISRGHEYE